MQFSPSNAPPPQTEQPWQLKQFRQSLKKQLKLKALLALIGSVSGQKCLLLTCGDNNGALNWYFRSQGGAWTWGDVAGQNLEEMSEFLGEPVHFVEQDRFPFASDQFDCVVAIDVLEHLEDDQPFLREIRRVLRPGGRAVVTVPNGDPNLLANRIRLRVGMSPDLYGHTRAGYSLTELRQSIERVGLAPTLDGGYSRWFTEMLELAINYGYVFVLSRKGSQPPRGRIAPHSAAELKKHGLAYRLYTLLFPLIRIISGLDRLLPARMDNAVIVVAFKH